MSTLTAFDAIREFAVLDAERRRYQSTYTKRKGEKQRLLEQLHKLQALVDHRVTKQARDAAGPITTSAEQNAGARELLRTQQLSLWGAHSMLSDWLNGQIVNPLSALASIKQRRGSDAKQFLTTRSRFQDLLKPYSREDKFENAKGDVCATRFDIVQFHGVQSVKQVFDALVFYLLNMEITISEKLADVTVREDCDLQEPEVIHHRLLSTDSCGLSTETNCASFMHLHRDQRHPDQNYAVLTSDFVDEDELRPYTPSTSLRNDITGAMMLTAQRQEGELIVVMRRACFLKLHRPEAISKLVPREAQEKISHWGDVMIKAARDQLQPSESYT